MNLTDRLHDEVAGVHADAHTLARTALADGRGRQHRQRQQRRTVGAVTIGLAAAAVAGIVVVSAALPGATEPRDRSGPATAPTVAAQTTAPSPEAPSAGPVATTAPITGRMSVVALMDAIDALPTGIALDGDVVPGSIAGSGDDGYAGEETYGRFTLDTEDGPTGLEINVQRWSSLGLPDTPCPTNLLECEATRTPDGDLVRTYRLDDGKDLDQWFGELVSTRRDLRVAVASSVPAGDPEPVTAAQLAAVVGWPTWDLQLPAEYAARGQALPSYDER